MHVQVGVADAAGGHGDQYLAPTGLRVAQVLDDEWTCWFSHDGRSHGGPLSRWLSSPILTLAPPSGHGDPVRPGRLRVEKTYLCDRKSQSYRCDMPSSSVQTPHTVDSTSASAELINHWIDGGVSASSSSASRGEVRDPATGRLVRAVLLADAATVDLAVQSAKRALPAWRELSLSRRMPLMRALRDAVRI